MTSDVRERIARLLYDTMIDQPQGIGGQTLPADFESAPARVVMTCFRQADAIMGAFSILSGVSDEMVEAFKLEWQRAHREFDYGNRVRRGLIEAIEAKPPEVESFPLAYNNLGYPVAWMHTPEHLLPKCLAVTVEHENGKSTVWELDPKREFEFTIDDSSDNGEIKIGLTGIWLGKVKDQP